MRELDNQNPAVHGGSIKLWATEYFKLAEAKTNFDPGVSLPPSTLSQQAKIKSTYQPPKLNYQKGQAPRILWTKPA